MRKERRLEWQRDEIAKSKQDAMSEYFTPKINRVRRKKAEDLSCISENSCDHFHNCLCNSEKVFSRLEKDVQERQGRKKDRQILKIMKEMEAKVGEVNYQSVRKECRKLMRTLY
jgi:hypothetical protein